jgi:hypothetical protein
VQGLRELVANGNPALERLPSFPNVVNVVDAEYSPESGLLHVEVTANSSLIEAPSFPSVDHGYTIRFDSNPSLTRVIGFAALEAVSSLELVNNATLAEIDFSSLRAADNVTLVDNPLLGPDQLAPLLELDNANGSAGAP